MSKDQTSMSEELFKIDGKPSTSQALPLALQHVVAMVVGCVQELLDFQQVIQLF